MNKTALISLFQKKISDQIELLLRSAKEAHEAAIHSESKAEDQYDTRGLEASYLAGAQSRRVAELEKSLRDFRTMPVRTYDPTMPIGLAALIELTGEEGRSQWYLICPSGGGLSVEWEGRTVHAITLASPLGEALEGRRQGDEVSVELRGQTRDLEIVKVG